MKDPAVDRPKKAVCSSCRWERSAREFHVARARPSGLQSICRKCRPKFNAVVNGNRTHVYDLLAAARARAKKQGVPFDLTEDDIVIPDVCPILGVRMRRGKGTSTPCSPSLDKIIPALGYVPGNIAVISRRANTIKNDASIHELRALVRWLEENTP